MLPARGSELERDFAFRLARQLVEGVVRGLTYGDSAALLQGAAAPAGALLGSQLRLAHL